MEFALIADGAGRRQVVFAFACGFGDAMRDESHSRHSWCSVCLPVVIMLLGVMTGCDRSPPPENNSTTTSVPIPSDPNADPFSQPDTAVRTLLKAFQTGEAGVIWDSLPPRHHEEINAFVREFAAKLDPEVWERLFVVARRIVKLLHDKRDLILGNPDLKLPSVNKRLFTENWTEVIALLQLLVDSELADLETLRNFDGETFFPKTGTRFLKQLVALSAKDPNDPFRKGFDAKVRLVDIDGSKATIGLMMTGNFVMTQQAIDEKPKETQMKVRQVEGVWIVADLDFGLLRMYQDGREMVAGIPDDAIQKNRGPLIKLLTTIEEDLDRIELAKTSREFTQALVLAQARINQLVSAGISNDDETESEDNSTPLGRTVTVVIQGEMTKATRQLIISRLDKLKRPGGKPKVTDGDGQMRIIIPTDRFLQEVVDAIDFGSVGDVDEVERRLTVTLKPQPKKTLQQDSPGN